MQGSGKIRIGLLLDSVQVPAWVLESVRMIAESDCCEIALVVLRANSGQEPSLWRRIVKNPGLLAWRMGRKIENCLFPSSNDSLELCDATELLENIPTLEVAPRETKFSDYFPQPDVEKIRDCKLDVLVRFGFRILRGEILIAAPLGVWSYHHGDNTKYRGGPPGVWEVIENNPVTGAVLQMLSEQLDDGLVLDRMFGETDRCYVNRNQSDLFWNAVGMLPRKLRELHLLRADDFLTRARQKQITADAPRGKIYREPRTFRSCSFAAVQITRIARQKLRRAFTREQWMLMFRFENQMSTSFENFTRIVPPKDRFWADPFVIYDGGLHHVFIEEFDYAAAKGHIAHMTITPDGKFTTPTVVLDRDYHLSYPFMFAHDGSYYMIPESYTNRTIELYRCKEFPHRWEFCGYLMKNIVALDTTLFEHNGKWWMFTGVQDNPASSLNTELHLFYADSPLSDNWTPHPQNPIVSDVRRARPAGEIFSHDGQILRPGQNCSREYGWGVTINRIETLNETEYSETPVETITPSWDRKLKCLHTLNHTDGLTVIDGRIDRF
ncbi:MAG: hypothetical protein KAR11_01560 [Phycisphaerae bacterium]|nr:hypothetical protein [Phycisphaerae bacterium]